MAVAFVQSVNVANGSGSNTVTTSGITTTNGNLIVVGVGVDYATLSSLTDNKGNTLTPIFTNMLGSGKYLSLYYIKNIIGGTGHTFTATASAYGGDISIIAQEFSGADTSAPLDASAWQAVTSTTSPTSGGMTASASTDLLLDFGVFNFAGETLSSSYTTNLIQFNNSGLYCGMSSRCGAVSTLPSSNSATFSSSIAVSGAMSGALFKIASVGSTAWTKNLSDSSISSDIAAKVLVLSKSDSSTMLDANSETGSASLSTGLSDTAVTSDTIIKKPSPGISDSSSTSDSFNKGYVLGKSDTGSTSDSNAKAIATVRVDSGVSGDGIRKNVTTQRSDSSFSSDLESLPNKKGLLDSVSVLDSPSSINNFLRNYTDSDIIIDAIQSYTAYYRNLADSVVTDDNYVPNFNKFFKTYIIYEENALKIVVNGNIVQTYS